MLLLIYHYYFSSEFREMLLGNQQNIPDSRSVFVNIAAGLASVLGTMGIIVVGVLYACGDAVICDDALKTRALLQQLSQERKCAKT